VPRIFYNELTKYGNLWNLTIISFVGDILKIKHGNGQYLTIKLFRTDPEISGISPIQKLFGYAGHHPDHLFSLMPGANTILLTAAAETTA